LAAGFFIGFAFFGVSRKTAQTNRPGIDRAGVTGMAYSALWGLAPGGSVTEPKVNAAAIPATIVTGAVGWNIGMAFSLQEERDLPKKGFLVKIIIALSERAFPFGNIAPQDRQSSRRSRSRVPGRVAGRNACRCPVQAGP
jgi:hypothetical protein